MRRVVFSIVSVSVFSFGFVNCSPHMAQSVVKGITSNLESDEEPAVAEKKSTNKKDKKQPNIIADE